MKKKTQFVFACACARNATHIFPVRLSSHSQTVERNVINNEINVNVVTVSFSESMCTRTKRATTKHQQQQQSYVVWSETNILETSEEKNKACYSGDTTFAFYS